MSKSRVTPLKAVTIPRLELTAAVVSTKTDSKAVLGYISNDAKRFHVFVANRVQYIRDRTDIIQWNYVQSESNPADYAARGLCVKELINNLMWWNGPKFLWKKLDNCGSSCEQRSILEDDPEVKKVSFVVTSKREVPFLDRLNYFSDWFRAKRATALCLRLQSKYKKTTETSEEKIDKKINVTFSPVTVSELEKAEKVIIKELQSKHYADEKRVLQTKENVLNKTSSLYKLDPFMDTDGIIKVRGRLSQANLNEASRHPVILPGKCHISELLICHYHQRVYPQGRGITLNEIRSAGYWIVGGSSMVAKHIRNCIVCKKSRGKTLDQKMSDLPKDRLEPSPPFTYCAVDYFGPFYVKVRRSEVKRYGALFTCLVSRAIHLEVAESMDTDSFLNAYRRFVGRRGPVRQLRSDRGTNFVGAKNELEICLKEMDQTKISNVMLKDNCDWINFKMNVPYASHMGGVWERQIRTVRNILSVILCQHGNQLDDDSLQTFMVEAESIVNSRPLTLDSINSIENLDPLTPNHLLTMKSKVVLPPPGNFQNNDLYSRKRWRRVQYLANVFWSRWKKEFLQSLQSRDKWIKPRRNVKIGDIVIVKDQNETRNHWKMGRVSEVICDEDGHVRKTKIMMSDSCLDKNGKRIKEFTYVERPIHSLIMLLEYKE
ncbi:uncharacterized protein LOC119570828 [Penaeus monodon]|uniref:uncharacterized protein LOC119570828 n=1 Tax=Penaeus monodon TaxID=6687 RepID=UPI0018A71845|nr:uncharacterized protein LOC119570828 [Penaeus monodon]